PDLDLGVPDRVSVPIEDATGQVGDLADGRREGVVDEDQVIVAIEGEPVRVEGPFGQRRGAGERFGGPAAGLEEGGAERPEEEAAIGMFERCGHGCAGILVEGVEARRRRGWYWFDLSTETG